MKYIFGLLPNADLHEANNNLDSYLTIQIDWSKDNSLVAVSGDHELFQKTFKKFKVIEKKDAAGLKGYKKAAYPNINKANPIDRFLTEAGN